MASVRYEADREFEFADAQYGDRSVQLAPESKTVIIEAVRMVSRLTGIDPSDISSVRFDAGGFVIVEQQLRDESGHHYVTDAGELASEKRIFHGPMTFVTMD